MYLDLRIGHGGGVLTLDKVALHHIGQLENQRDHPVMVVFRIKGGADSSDKLVEMMIMAFGAFGGITEKGLIGFQKGGEKAVVN